MQIVHVHKRALEESELIFFPFMKNINNINKKIQVGYKSIIILVVTRKTWIENPLIKANL